MHVNTRVTRIKRSDMVTGKSEKGLHSYFINDGEHPYDAVVFAAPLEFSLANGKLNLDDQILENIPPSREYQTTHVTFVVGELNAT